MHAYIDTVIYIGKRSEDHELNTITIHLPQLDIIIENEINKVNQTIKLKKGKSYIYR